MANEAVVTRLIEVDVRASANAAAHLKQISGQLGGLEETAKKTQGSMGSFFDFMKNSVRGFAGLFVAGELTKLVLEINRMNDESKILVERMKLVTSNSAAAGDAFLEVTRIARDQGRELDGVAKLYEKTARAADLLGISTRGVSAITEGFAASLRISGSSTQEANAAMIQFGQVLASGKFQGDEFRSMMENNNVFMAELAKASGITMDKLRQMSKDGALNAEFLRQALFKMGDDGRNMLQRLMDKAENLPMTFDQALNGTKASFVELLSAMNQTADKAEGIFTRMAKNVAKALSQAAQTVREETMIQNAILRETGRAGEQKDVAGDNTEMDQILRYTQRIQLAEKEIVRLNNERAALLKNNSDETRRTIQMIDKSIKENEGQIKGIQEVLDARIRQANTKNSPFTLPDWKPTPAEPKKSKKGSEKDILGDLIDDLDAAQLEVENRVDNLGKWARKVAEAERQFAMDSGTKYTVETASALIRSAREKAAVLDADEMELGFQKFLNKVLQKDLERSLVDGQKYIDEFNTKIANYVKRGRRLNPLIEIEDEIKDIQQAMKNPLVTDDQKKSMEDLIESLRLKLAERLMGVKETVRSSSEQIGDVWASAWDRMSNDLLSFTKSNKELISDFVIYFLREMAKIEMAKTMQPLVERGREVVGNFFSTLFQSANGSAFGLGGVRLFADGGVLNGPTPFTYNGGQNAGVAGEAGPEAIMPLRRGADGKLGVGSAPVTVNVYNNGSNTRSRVEEHTDSKGNREIKVFIEDIVENTLASGRVDNVMSSSYGVTRKGK